jgi:hypothetical protein
MLLLAPIWRCMARSRCDFCPSGFAELLQATAGGATLKFTFF